MHLTDIIFEGIFMILFLFDNNSGKIVNIGIVNSKWRDILKPKIEGRKWTDRCQLHVINLPPNKSFFESINKASDLISLYKLDVIIGDSRIDIAQAAAFHTVPFIAFDNKIHVRTRPEYDNMPHFYSLPVPEKSYALATFDILQLFQISRVAIIIDHSIDYQDFIKPFFEIKSMFCKVWTIPFNASKNQNEMEIIVGTILDEIRDKGYMDIVVKTNKINLNRIMTKARYFGMISIPIRWYVLGFVCENFNIESLKHIFSNFTFINEICSARNLQENIKFEENSLVNQFIQIIRLSNWEFSAPMLNSTLRNKVGSSLSFDNNGYRNAYTLVYNTLSRLPNQMLSLIGSWQKKLNKPGKFHLKINDSDINSVASTIPKYLRIIALEEHPHLIVKGNSTFIGFGVDLISKLSELLKFNYTIKVVVSKEGGLKGRWDKLLAELIEGKADISLGPVVQTKEREENLDFSTSFKQREISLVMKKPTNSPSFFQFLGPFSTNIWLCVVSSIIILVVILWVLEHFHEKYFPATDRIKFDLKESSWFIFASTLQGGTENVPFSIPGRILTASLYFFILIIVTSYTANLAAFLTVKAYTNPIDSVDDLVKLPPDSKIKFGTVKNSAIFDFFYHSEIESFQKIGKIMSDNNKGWLVNNSTEGYQRAINENYVFIWDDSVNQYEIFNEPDYKCQLYIVGIPFGKRSFAVGMAQGSTYKEQINSAILHLLEAGTIENLEHKWWKSTSICSDSSSNEISSGSLTINDLAGVFLILLCGVVIAIISLLIEIIIQRGRPATSIRQCCSQFFSHLPSSSEPPIVPSTPKNTIDHSRYSTTVSSTTERPQSPISDEIYNPPNRFDFQLDNESNSKGTPV